MFKKCILNRNDLFPKIFSVKSNNNFLNYSKFYFSNTKNNIENLTNNFNLTDTKKLDFYERNFQFNTPPENRVQFNDLDLGMASELFKNIDFENLSNIPLLNGRFSRYWCLIEDSIHHLIMFLTNDLNLGMGFSIILLATVSRLIFYSFTKKNIANSQILRFLTPEQEEYTEKLKKLKQSGENKLIFIENTKFNELKENYGIKMRPLNFFVGFFQAIVLSCWAGLVQRFSLNIDDYPEMMTGGFLWFRDLSMSDPYFILPMVNCSLLFLTIYNTNSINKSFVLKLRRIIFVFPLLSFPFMCTLETGILLYIVAVAFCNLAIVRYVNSEKMKKKLGCYNFLPDSKLEKINKFRLKNNKFEERNFEFIPTNPTPITNSINQANEKIKTDKDKPKIKPTGAGSAALPNKNAASPKIAKKSK